MEISPLYRAKRLEIARWAILVKEPDCSGGRGAGGEYVLDTKMPYLKDI